MKDNMIHSHNNVTTGSTYIEMFKELMQSKSREYLWIYLEQLFKKQAQMKTRNGYRFYQRRIKVISEILEERLI